MSAVAFVGQGIVVNTENQLRPAPSIYLLADDSQVIRSYHALNVAAKQEK